MSIEQQILEHTYSQPDEKTTGRDIARVTGIAFEKVRPFIRHLLDMGRLRYVGREGPGQDYKCPAAHDNAIYCITTAGIARLNPDRVRELLLRRCTPREEVLHG